MDDYKRLVEASTHILVSKGRLVGFARFHGYGPRTAPIYSVVRFDPWRLDYIPKRKLPGDLVYRGQPATLDRNEVVAALARLFLAWGLPIPELDGPSVARGLSGEGAARLVEALDKAAHVADTERLQLTLHEIAPFLLPLTGREIELLTEPPTPSKRTRGGR